MLKHRETKQRRIVLETVRSHTDHPTANTICEEVHAIDGKISQSTVYRNLNCLSEDGEILPFNYLSDPDEKVANATGYTVFRHRAVFEGICPECKTENNI